MPKDKDDGISKAIRYLGAGIAAAGTAYSIAKDPKNGLKAVGYGLMLMAMSKTGELIDYLDGPDNSIEASSASKTRQEEVERS